MGNLPPQRRLKVLLGCARNLRLHAHDASTARLQVIPNQRHKRAQRRQHQRTARRVGTVSHHRMVALRMTERELLHKIQHIVQSNRTQTAEHTRDQRGKSQPEQEAKRKRTGTRRIPRTIRRRISMRRHRKRGFVCCVLCVGLRLHNLRKPRRKP